MDYEKAYKEALKVIESLYNVVKYQSNSDALLTRQTIEKAFPELKECEDEKTRKELIEFIKHGNRVFESLEQKNRFWAWLEKQGEQKPVISDDALREGIVHFGITQYQIDNWLKKYVDVEKQGERKSSWSKEDEQMIQDIIEAIDTQYSVSDYKEMVDWLKSLEYRVQPQPKHEWSEEDERTLEAIIKKIEANKSAGPEYDEKVYDVFLSWLKSLKPNHWKPNEEQINTLWDAIVYVESCNSNFKGSGSVLENLYNDLKKL